MEDVKTKEALPAKRAPRQDIDKQRHRSAIDRLAAPKSVAAPKVARSIGPLKRKFLKLWSVLCIKAEKKTKFLPNYHILFLNFSRQS